MASLTDEGGGGQLALVHAADGAEGAHGAARPEAVQNLAGLDQRFASEARGQFTVSLEPKEGGAGGDTTGWSVAPDLYGINLEDAVVLNLLHTTGLESPPPTHRPPGYLLEVLDAVLAAEALLLAVHQQEVVGGGAAGQVVAALLAAVHDEPVGPAVHVEARVAADLVGHGLKADLVPDL